MIYRDSRLGFEVVTLFRPKDYGMRLPDRMRNSVAFLFANVESGGAILPRYGGTGFFVSIPGDDPNIRHVYLVTAAHCVRRAKERGNLWARHNTYLGQPVPPRDVGFDWAVPDDPSADVAAIHWNHFRLKGENASDLPMPIQVESFVTPDLRERYKIGIGDDLSLLGLFSYHHGTKKNIPIVRSGIIAAMPDELIYDSKTGQRFWAYLAEVRSIAGLSGSPVWVNIVGYGRDAEGNVNEAGRHLLLGLIRGHWDHTDAFAGDESELDGGDRRRLNVGIATVTPASELLTLLYGDALVRERRQIDLELTGSELVED